MNISEISAELLLTNLYPELTGQWMARHVGTFYRNYNSDAMSVYPDEPTVVLSRDGFLQLLPHGLLDGDDKQQMKLLRDAFLPLDAFWFNAKLQLELQVSQTLSSKLEYVLQEFFGFDLAAQQNPYVRQAAGLLPFVRNKRGDRIFVRDLLASLLHCSVEMKTGCYSDTDTTVAWLPKIRYNLLIPGLTSEQYLQQMQEVQPLFDFIREWFMPAEVVCEFEMKDAKAHSVGNTMILNYNTELN